MDYYLLDILNILMNVELKFCVLYNNISIFDGNTNIQFKTAAKILSGEEKKHAEAYMKLIEDMKLNQNLMINQKIYENAVQMLETFKKGIKKVNTGETNELIRFAVQYEKENVILLQNIVSEMENTPMDIRVIDLFNELIKIEEKHSATLNLFLKKETSNEN